VLLNSSPAASRKRTPVIQMNSRGALKEPVAKVRTGADLEQSGLLDRFREPLP
jgi:hypothetical protein